MDPTTPTMLYSSSNPLQSNLATPSTPFLQHLIAVLSIYELAPPFSPTPIPRWDGPHTWQTDAILRSLGSLAKMAGRVPPGSSNANGNANGNGHGSDGKDDDARDKDNDGKWNNAAPAIAVDSDDDDEDDTSHNGADHEITTPRTSARSSSRHGSGDSGGKESLHMPLPPRGGPAASYSSGCCPQCGFHFSPSASSTVYHSSSSSPTSDDPAYASSFNGTPGLGAGRDGDDGNPASSPLGVVPPGGPLAMAAIESGLSAVEELRSVIPYLLVHVHVADGYG